MIEWNVQELADPTVFGGAPAFLMERLGIPTHTQEMPDGAPQYSLSVLGSFNLRAPDGARVAIPSKKGRALIALLAMAREGERSRAWLQDKLWGSRQLDQAQSSLRRELSNLRKLLNDGDGSLLYSEHDRVRLDLSRLSVDARSQAAEPAEAIIPAEFLEGLDIPGEDGFEEWLREQRSAISDHARVADARPVVDLSQPAPGFGGRPALAVLAFANLTGDSAQDYLAEGIGEDLIDRLSRLRWLPVIARSSSFAVEADADREAIGRSLGAKYLLEGRLRQLGGEFWLTASLSEADSGLVLWSPRIRLPDHPSPNDLEPLAADLVGVISARIEHAEESRAHASTAGQEDINELIWRGRWHLNRFTRADAEIARELLARALAIDPTSSEALIQATWNLCWTLWTQRGTQAEIVEMRAMARRAILADGDDSRGHMLAGIGEVWLKRPWQAAALLKRALELNPSLVLAHAQLGGCYNLMGRPELALDPLRAAMRLSPNDRHLFYPLGEMALAHDMLGDWGAAIDYADQALQRRPAYWYALMIKIDALARSGDPVGAEAAFDELLRAKPGFNLSYIDWLPFVDRTWPDHFIEGLRLASPRAHELDRSFQA